jgi:hypothetical protein
VLELVSELRIDPGCAPGGLVAQLVLNGKVMDAAPLQEEVEEVAESVAIRHRGAALAAQSEGGHVEIRIFDGDTGALISVLRP